MLHRTQPSEGSFTHAGTIERTTLQCNVWHYFMYKTMPYTFHTEVVNSGALVETFHSLFPSPIGSTVAGVGYLPMLKCISRQRHRKCRVDDLSRREAVIHPDAQRETITCVSRVRTDRSIV